MFYSTVCRIQKLLYSYIFTSTVFSYHFFQEELLLLCSQQCIFFWLLKYLVNKQPNRTRVWKKPWWFFWNRRKTIVHFDLYGSFRIFIFINHKKIILFWKPGSHNMNTSLFYSWRTPEGRNLQIESTRKPCVCGHVQVRLQTVVSTLGNAGQVTQPELSCKWKYLLKYSILS